jgi:hypothetical protein
VARQDDNIELGRALSEISYPCDKIELLRRARLNGTTEELMTRLDMLPERVYGGADEAVMFVDDAEQDRGASRWPDPPTGFGASDHNCRSWVNSSR